MVIQSKLVLKLKTCYFSSYGLGLHGKFSWELLWTDHILIQ